MAKKKEISIVETLEYEKEYKFKGGHSVFYRFGKDEDICITSCGSVVSVSLLEKGDLNLPPIHNLENRSPIASKNISAPPPSTTKRLKEPAVEGSNPFNAGDKVQYNGASISVIRAYVYKGKPYCILEGNKQVSASRLTKL